MCVTWSSDEGMSPDFFVLLIRATMIGMSALFECDKMLTDFVGCWYAVCEYLLTWLFFASNIIYFLPLELIVSCLSHHEAKGIYILGQTSSSMPRSQTCEYPTASVIQAAKYLYRSIWFVALCCLIILRSIHPQGSKKPREELYRECFHWYLHQTTSLIFFYSILKYDSIFSNYIVLGESDLP